MSRVEVFVDAAGVARAAADAFEALLRERGKDGAVLGLATGSTPLPLYRELVRRHREEGLPFAHATSFNLDEYWPIAPDHPRSFARFMDEHLFDHLDLPAARRHIPSGLTPVPGLAAACQDYEAAIAAAGGIDLQVLGIGVNGHIGFNEPGALPGSRTRMVELDDSTRARARGDFGGEEVPARAVTMGLATILEARRILVLATGPDKAAAVAAAIDGPATTALPASWLQQHPDVTWLLDAPAAAAR